MFCCQDPALMNHPMSLELEVTAPPRCTIKTSGASVSVVSNVKVLVLPPGKAAVQLSSMTMVNTNPEDTRLHNPTIHL